MRRALLTLPIPLVVLVTVGLLLLAPVPDQAEATEDGATPASSQPVAKKRHRDREVMFVGNNWAGTATVVNARTHRVIKTLNIVPDRKEELAEIYASPDRLAYYLAIQQAVGEGNDQYVDDMFTTRDGELLAVSRPSFADVVWIDLASGRIVAEQQMDGYRTDHMAVSPNGRRLLVSDSTARSVHEFVMGGRGKPRTGTRLRSFESGETPHENNYSRSGRRIFHASIGRVYTPGDNPDPLPLPLPGGGVVHDEVKADRWLQIVATRNFKVQRRWDMGKELAEAGHEGMSSAVRPMAITPDQKTAFLQVSFLHGIVEFAFNGQDPSGGGDYASGTRPEPPTGVVRRVIPLPVSEKAANTPREEYVLDSAHHGIAINKRGTRLCVAGTMSDYAAVVSRRTGRPTIFTGAARFLPGRTYSKPYWATTSPTDGHCWVSMSGSDLVTVIDYRTKRVVAEVPVGRHPQRVREGHVDRRVLLAWANGGASGSPDLSTVPIPAGQLTAAQAWTAAQDTAGTR